MEAALQAILKRTPEEEAEWRRGYYQMKKLEEAAKETGRDYILGMTKNGEFALYFPNSAKVKEDDKDAKREDEDFVFTAINEPEIPKPKRSIADYVRKLEKEKKKREAEEEAKRAKQEAIKAQRKEEKRMLRAQEMKELEKARLEEEEKLKPTYMRITKIDRPPGYPTFAGISFRIEELEMVSVKPVNNSRGRNILKGVIKRVHTIEPYGYSKPKESAWRGGGDQTL